MKLYRYSCPLQKGAIGFCSFTVKYVRDGDGRRANLDTAIKSLKDIAERGDSSAAYILGSAYLERKLSIANVDAAIKYLKLAQS